MEKPGGIFLPNKPNHQTTSPRFFSNKPQTVTCLNISQQLSKQFLQSHEHYASQTPLVGIDHVIIYHKGNLSLWNKNSINDLELIARRNTPAVKEAYQFIKSLSHCSVWLSMVMQSLQEKKAMTPYHYRDIQQIICCLNQLKLLVSDQELIAKLYEQLCESTAPNDTLSTAKGDPIDLLLSFAIQALSKGNNEQEMKSLLQSFLKSSQELNTHCASYATKIQLQGMHRILLDWTDKHLIQVKNTRVLIVVASGPREQLIERQYFEEMLAKQNLKNDEQGIRYIHCIEMLPQQIATVTDKELIGFLQQHELNSSIGKNMLNNPLGMDKDVLSEHAPEALKGICPFKH
ncbi:hypothetical protein [Legionella waltersii]|uniref:Uncharacterized protein n=1 Tax=Legionella waltersii TaxID=66969 RepID=A0A0W1ANN7_9GAMM|nr:hypothetical protein [Legionella waltersii]KTD82851.1 hypothetical protein Lwal_0329 [Legionella waltersii]SNV01808.1 Uncharacterised protein [Legionella waltersii]